MFNRKLVQNACGTVRNSLGQNKTAGCGANPASNWFILCRRSDVTKSLQPVRENSGSYCNLKKVDER